jgi:hypothetical protein
MRVLSISFSVMKLKIFNDEFTLNPLLSSTLFVHPILYFGLLPLILLSLSSNPFYFLVLSSNNHSIFSGYIYFEKQYFFLFTLLISYYFSFFCIFFIFLTYSERYTVVFLFPSWLIVFSSLQNVQGGG